MNNKYNDWISDSQRWQDKLEEVLEKHGGSDVVTKHTNVVFAFPSKDPHPDSFDYPSIDRERLTQWAESKGWKVQFAPEMAPKDTKNSRSVRFTKE